VTTHATLEARAQALTSLVWGILGRLCYRAECMLWVLPWRWLYILPVQLLRWLLHLSVGHLHLELCPLHLKLRALHLHWH
jgi:hypothetical protein